MQNETFKVDSLNEITKRHFKMACVAAMSEQPELRGILGVPGSDDYILYAGEEQALVSVRNWSRMLTLLIVSKNGTWLTSDHIDGMGCKKVIDEAYRRFKTAKPYIEKELSKAFDSSALKPGTESRWLKTAKEYFQKIEQYVKNRNA